MKTDRWHNKWWIRYKINETIEDYEIEKPSHVLLFSTESWFHHLALNSTSLFQHLQQHFSTSLANFYIYRTLSTFPANFQHLKQNFKISNKIWTSPTNFINISNTTSTAPTNFINISNNISTSPANFINIANKISMSPTNVSNKISTLTLEWFSGRLVTRRSINDRSSWYCSLHVGQSWCWKMWQFVQAYKLAKTWCPWGSRAFTVWSGVTWPTF